MCNLYRLRAETIWKLYGKNLSEVLGNAPRPEVYPGGQGIVQTPSGELRTMAWGFPLKQFSKRTGEPIKPKAVNNARTDKLLTTFWKSAFVRPEQRCLIPLSAFAEAVGECGSMTRAWLSVAGEEGFCCAGIWRDSIEWGPVYSMVMTGARDDLLDIHDRMPVILKSEHYDRWINATVEEALELCVPWPETLDVEPTDEPWVRR